MQLSDAAFGRNDGTRRQSRSPLVPTVSDDLRDAFDETLWTIGDSDRSVSSLERSFTRTPVRDRQQSARAALEHAIQLGREFRHDLQSWSITAENWERMAQRRDYDSHINPTSLISRLSDIRLDVTQAMDRVIEAYESVHDAHSSSLRRTNAIRYPRPGISFEIESPPPERSGALSTLHVRPLTPSAGDAARNGDDMPPLRRIGHRSIVDEPTRTPLVGFVSVPTPPPDGARSLASGLGDRTRSTSPENDAGAWDMMLTTIEPDASLPSADSSFTSAVASASFSAGSSSRPGSTSTASFETHVTVPDEGEDACESEDDIPDLVDSNGNIVYSRNRQDSQQQSGQNASRVAANFDAAAAEFNRAYMRSRLNPLVPSEPRILGTAPARSSSDELGRRVDQLFEDVPRTASPLPLNPPEDGFVDDDPTLTEGLNSAAAARPTAAEYSSDFFSNRDRLQVTRRDISPSSSIALDHISRSVDRPHRQSRPADPLADPEIEHMRSILERMAQSGDIIPEDWWVSAGLMPLLAQSGIGNSFGPNVDRNGPGARGRL